MRLKPFALTEYSFGYSYDHLEDAHQGCNQTSPHIHLTFSDCSITKKRLIDPDFNAALECLLEAHAATTYQI